jgi:hypothetical protein
MAKPERPCAHCGQMIPNKPSDPQDGLTAEHAVPLQFHPKFMRSVIRGQLWTVPSHRRCNEGVKQDEEYFFQYLYGLVFVQNPPMANVLMNEIRRRSAHESTRGLLRRLLGDVRKTTPGGILLPPEVLWVSVNRRRIENVVIKISKCLFYKDHGRYMPRANCLHCERCDDKAEVQEVFNVICCETEPRAVVPEIFQYWHADIDGLHHYSMLFWQAFMFCTIFREPE